MRILAIDPGNVESAYVILDGKTIVEKGKVFNQEMLDLVEHHGSLLSGPELVDACVIEMIASYGMAVGKDVFETVFWIGRFFQAFSRGGRRCERIFRMAVKMHLCHSSKAKDGNIRQALIDKLGAPGTKKFPGPTFGVSADIWAALGVGITWLETESKNKPKKVVLTRPAKPARTKKSPKVKPRLKPRTPPEYEPHVYDEEFADGDD